MVRVLKHGNVATFIEMRQYVCSGHNFITLQSTFASDNVGSVSARYLREFSEKRLRITFIERFCFLIEFNQKVCSKYNLKIEFYEVPNESFEVRDWWRSSRRPLPRRWWRTAPPASWSMTCHRPEINFTNKFYKNGYQKVVQCIILFLKRLPFCNQKDRLVKILPALLGSGSDCRVLVPILDRRLIPLLKYQFNKSFSCTFYKKLQHFTYNN
jgi:hypothetical protein